MKAPQIPLDVGSNPTGGPPSHMVDLRTAETRLGLFRTLGTTSVPIGDDHQGSCGDHPVVCLGLGLDQDDPVMRPSRPVASSPVKTFQTVGFCSSIGRVPGTRAIIAWAT